MKKELRVDVNLECVCEEPLPFDIESTCFKKGVYHLLISTKECNCKGAENHHINDIIEYTRGFIDGYDKGRRTK